MEKEGQRVIRSLVWFIKWSVAWFSMCGVCYWHVVFTFTTKFSGCWPLVLMHIPTTLSVSRWPWKDLLARYRGCLMKMTSMSMMRPRHVFRAAGCLSRTVAVRNTKRQHQMSPTRFRTLWTCPKRLGRSGYIYITTTTRLHLTFWWTLCVSFKRWRDVL